MVRDLTMIGISKPEDLYGKDALTLYKKLCRLTGKRQDPCILDTFMSAISFVNGGPALPWWNFTDKRKARVKREK